MTQKPSPLYKRKSPHRYSKPVILLICEGIRTEPNYFSFLKEKLRLSGLHIGPNCGQNLPIMVSYIKDHLTDLKLEYMFDEIWCICDDDGIAMNRAALNDAFQAGIKVAYSNPCFELWIYLHLQYSSASVSTSQICDKLRLLVPAYSKTWCRFAEVYDNTNAAIRHAKRLREHHEQAGSSLYDNPSTTVDMLVTQLMTQVRATKGTPLHSAALDG
ncbi:MAG: RloB family protein [Armatimonadota bacterium]